jgi:hypothetical protein
MRTDESPAAVRLMHRCRSGSETERSEAMSADLNALTTFSLCRRILPAALLILAAACRPGVPVVDPSERPPSLDGTVSGHLATTAGDRVGGRKIELVEINTGSRHPVTTDANGAFTVKVPPGKYRLDVELQAGERIEKAPKEIDINKSDLDSNLEIVIGR